MRATRDAGGGEVIRFAKTLEMLIDIVGNLKFGFYELGVT